MPPLSKLQQGFNSAVLGKETLPPGLTGFVSGRLHIYQDAYLSRIVEALQADFKVLHRALGEESFASLVRNFLQTFPSQFTNITEIGRNLSEYLKASDYGVEMPFVVDLAALEWARVECFWAEEKPSLDPVKLSQLTPEALESLTLTLHPSARLQTFNYEVLSVFDNFEKPDEDFFNPPESILNHVLIYRAADWPRAEKIAASEYKILEKLRRGMKLEDLSLHLGELKNPQESFKHWTEIGIWV